MIKKIGMWIGAVAASVILSCSFGAVTASADEMNIIGLTDDLIRLYITSKNELDIIGVSFAAEAGEEFDTFTVENNTMLLNQFTVAKINGQYANVRTGPSTDYDIVGRIFAGAVATAVDTSGEWTKIVSGNVEGYVKSEFLVFGDEAVKEYETRSKNHCRVTSTTLNLRTSASTSSGIVHVIPGWSDLLILEKVNNGSWYKVKYTDAVGQSFTGYVSSEYVTKGYYYAITKKRVDELANDALIANCTWPFPGEYNIWSDYGYRIHPIYKEYRLHKGLDIGGAEGANLVSICDGVVTTAAYDPSSGNYIIITYADGFQAKYLHCKQIYVKVGQSVKKGQVVAACGRTGDATGSHLHFALYQNNTMLDPMDYLISSYYSLKWHCTRN